MFEINAVEKQKAFKKHNGIDGSVLLTKRAGLKRSEHQGLENEKIFFFYCLFLFLLI